VAVKAGAEEGSIDLETFGNIIEENPQSTAPAPSKGFPQTPSSAGGR
jgi:hypothetical protein